MLRIPDNLPVYATDKPPALPGKKADGNPYDAIYIKDYLVKFLLTRLYGKKSRNAEYPNLITIIDSNYLCYNLDRKLPSETIKDVCLNLACNNGQSSNKLEEDIKKAIGNDELIQYGTLDPSVLFEKILREFIVQTLGNDIRVPDPSLMGSGGGYEVHIKPVSDYNEAVLIKNLRTERNETPKLVLIRAFNKLVKQKLDEMFESIIVHPNTSP